MGTFSQLFTSVVLNKYEFLGDMDGKLLILGHVFFWTRGMSQLIYQ